MFSTTPLLALALALLVGGCAPAIPAELPASSPASLDAAEAEPTPVTVALSEDPPLPGQDAQRWPGLEPDGPGGAHDHHHGHDEPAAASYVCPMHPEVVSERPGTCPKCGMALEPKK